MHVVTTRRTYKGRVYETHLLRRSYREGDRVKNETLGNLSHLPAPVIDLVRRALRGETFVAARRAPGGLRLAPAWTRASGTRSHAAARDRGTPRHTGEPGTRSDLGTHRRARAGAPDQAGHHPLVGDHHPGQDFAVADADERDL